MEVFYPYQHKYKQRRSPCRAIFSGVARCAEAPSQPRALRLTFLILLVGNPFSEAQTAATRDASMARRQLTTGALRQRKAEMREVTSKAIHKQRVTEMRFGIRSCRRELRAPAA